MDELGRSVVSGRLFSRDLLVGSEDRLAHPSEFVRCEVSGRRLLPDESGVCAVTGRRVARDLLFRSELSGKLALRSETRYCCVTNKRVARDELERCSVTGLLALPSELETCAETGVRALRRELVQCADTAAWVVPAAAGRSDYRPRWVVKRLLKRSEKAPGRLGTVNEFQVCSVSKKALLLDELEPCSVSKRLGDRDLLVTCGITGQRLLKEESYWCAWLGQRASKRLVGVCALTRVSIAKRYLDINGMLGPLARMLDGDAHFRESSRDDLIPTLKRIDPKFFATVSTVSAVKSPGGDMLAVCATVTERGWFTNRIRHVGFLLVPTPESSIVGTLVLGDRVKGEWEQVRAVSFGRS